MEELFSVIEYYDDETCLYVARNVGPEAAASVFAVSALCAESQLGLTRRIAVTFGAATSLEWVYGEGTRRVVAGA